MPNGPHRITGLPFEADIYESELAISDPELKVSCTLVNIVDTLRFAHTGPATNPSVNMRRILEDY